MTAPGVVDPTPTDTGPTDTGPTDTVLTDTVPLTRIGPREAFVQGARALAPMALAVAPFGLAIGATTAASDIPPIVGWLGAPLILAGSAQLTAVQMLEDGATPLVIVISALVINARIVMYGAAMAPWFREETFRRRMLLAIPLIDHTYLVGTARFAQGDLDRRTRQAFWAGGGVVLCSAWIAVQTLALVGGARLPEGAGLELAAPLALAGLLAMTVRGRSSTVAAAVAAVVVVGGAGLPFQSAILVAALAGVAAGVTADRSTAAESENESDDEPEGAS